MHTLHDDLDHVWRALANPNRRRMLDLLRDRPMTTGALAEAVGENRFVVMQHLALLREARLVTVIAEGRRRINFPPQSDSHSAYLRAPGCGKVSEVTGHQRLLA